MPNFRYKARSRHGKNVTGVLEASSKPAALEILLSSGQTPIFVREKGGGSALKEWISTREVDLSPADAGTFSLDLSRLLSSGFSLHQALELVVVSTESKAARELAQRCVGHVAKGGQLSTVIAEDESGPAQALAGLVKGGESAGDLHSVLEEAAKSFGARAAFKERLASALIYPVIILFMIAMTLIIFFTVVLPRLEPLFEGVGDKLPASTQWLLVFGRFNQLWMPWILGAILIGFVGYRVLPGLRAAVTRRVHKVLLGPMGLGASRLSGYAAYARTLGLLLNSGVPLPNASKIAAGGVGNVALSEALQEMGPDLRAGVALSKTMTKLPTIPDMLQRMTFLGERSGKLGPALVDAAGILERKAQTRLDRLLAALTPAVTIFLGLIVALVVGALFLGIASLTEVEL